MQNVLNKCFLMSSRRLDKKQSVKRKRKAVGATTNARTGTNHRRRERASERALPSQCLFFFSFAPPRFFPTFYFSTLRFSLSRGQNDSVLSSIMKRSKTNKKSARSTSVKGKSRGRSAFFFIAACEQ